MTIILTISLEKINWATEELKNEFQKRSLNKIDKVKNLIIKRFLIDEKHIFINKMDHRVYITWESPLKMEEGFYSKAKSSLSFYAEGAAEALGLEVSYS